MFVVYTNAFHFRRKNLKFGMISCFLTKSNHSRFTYLGKIVDGILTSIVPGLDDKKSFFYGSL